ncbi:hypothetical protein [uncultured Psychroserpens sp.]|nr:hypothetical protein [uncultured Psychroserpens sp.]
MNNLVALKEELFRKTFIIISEFEPVVYLVSIYDNSVGQVEILQQLEE